MIRSQFSFAAPFDEVWDATVKILEDSELEVVESHKDTGEISAQCPSGVPGGRENIAVYIGKTDKEEETLIEVSTKVGAKDFAINWEKTLFDNLYILMPIKK
ncbi:MAG: hypothetical protein OEQ18_03370 [Gammaproteobacteria bacterium]|nr:hypothetical protein [Gammaproteobacteria bacterium]